MNPVLAAKKHAKKIAKEKGIKLKEALKRLATANGFADWKHYKNSIDTFWYSKASPFLNHWFVSHAEAADFRNNNGGYLLTYKGQYFVASANYIEYLGFNPDDETWKMIDYDVSSSHALEKFFTYSKPKKSPE